MRHVPLFIIALAVVAFGVGCSSESSTTTTANTPPTAPAKTPESPAPTPDAPKPTDTMAAKPADATAPAAATGSTVSFTKDIKPAADKYCMPCHGDAGKGGLSFTKYKTDEDAKADKGKFARAASEVENKKMPPQKSAQPTDDERTALVAALKGV